MLKPLSRENVAHCDTVTPQIYHRSLSGNTLRKSMGRPRNPEDAGPESQWPDEIPKRLRQLFKNAQHEDVPAFPLKDVSAHAIYAWCMASPAKKMQAREAYKAWVKAGCPVEGMPNLRQQPAPASERSKHSSRTTPAGGTPT